MLQPNGGPMLLLFAYLCSGLFSLAVFAAHVVGAIVLFQVLNSALK